MSGEIHWDDPRSKESHPGKTLAKHIEEIREVYRHLKEGYDPPVEPEVMRWAEDIIDKVIEYHDMGKLHPKWSVGQERREVNHSEMSIKWILDHHGGLGIPGLDSDEFWLITYLILKHHSRLSKPSLEGIRDKELKKRFRKYFAPHLNRRSLFNILRNLGFERAVILADLYGMFKIADMFSALGISDLSGINPRLNIGVEDVKEILASGGGLDEERFEKQRRLVDSGDVTLLRAYTGWGKTTASILYAVDSGRRRVFYILPTITAINKFHRRMSNIFGGDVGKYFYFYEWERVVGWGSDDDLVGRDLADTMMIERLFLRYPITITTVDQLVLTFLRVWKYHLRRASFYNSVLILDEVHLYTPRLLILLLKLLRDYHRLYRLRVLMMSATLPTPLMNYIRDFYGEVGISVDIMDHMDGYRGRRRVMYEVRDESVFDVLDDAVSRFEDGESILVICNTVKRAVRAARILREKMGSMEDRVVLLHSRYMYMDRRAIEDRVERLVDSSEPHIFVSTQVSEVSLDVSYNYLYTEAAPISSIIQRFGRVNRRGESGEMVGEVNATILTKTGVEEGYAPYSKYEVSETIEVLRSLEGERLVNEYMLLEEYDNRFSIEEYLEEAENFKLDSIIKRYGYLISLDFTEESVKQFIEYRERDSVLGIPSPEMIHDEERAEGLADLIEMLSQPGLPYSDRRELFARLKGYLVPMPIYFLRDSGERRGFPIIDMADHVYHPYYGLAPSNEVLEYVY